jgi:ubiquinone/menaquinone biosynthesis C-methylase UbiE
MPDVYATIATADRVAVDRLAAAMELRASDPQQRAMLLSYLDEITLEEGSRVLEVGCGTGAVSRVLVGRPGVAEVTAVDPSPLLLEQARRLSENLSNLTFVQGDGRRLPLPDGHFDAVVMHTVLSHVPDVPAVLGEVYRVLRPGGRLALFDGDYATMTVATGDADPLQACVDAYRDSYINDPWLVRHLSMLVWTAGFADANLRSHGYLQTVGADYLLSIVDRGADALVIQGRAGTDLAESLKAEARRRIENRSFFGHIGYASLTARRPG